MIYRPKHYYHGTWFKYPSRLSCSDVFVKSCMDLFVNILRHFLGILHYCDVIIGAIASQITSLMIISSTVYSSADQRKHLSSASLVLCAGNRLNDVTQCCFGAKWIQQVLWCDTWNLNYNEYLWKKVGSHIVDQKGIPMNQKLIHYHISHLIVTLRKVSKARDRCLVFQSLWHLAGVLKSLLPWRVQNITVKRPFQNPIPRVQVFEIWQKDGLQYLLFINY